MKMFMSIAAAVVALTSSAYASEATCNETHALALNMYHEARGEGVDAMIMVGEVTLNRVESDRFPDTVCGVVYQGRRDSRGNMVRHQCQFSWYCDGQSDRVSSNVVEQRAWDQAQNLAEGLLDGSVDRFNNGATHFINPSKVRRMPRWTEQFAQVGSIGGHVFYVQE